MNNKTYKNIEERVGTKEIFDLVFKRAFVKYGLHEFPGEILKQIKAFKKEDGRFYIRCLKRGAEYLALCINSIVGQMQIERDAGGSIIAHWKPEQIKRLQIPILPIPIQQKIAELVRQSHESRKKAKELLEQAKRRVDDMIENA